MDKDEEIGAKYAMVWSE